MEYENTQNSKRSIDCFNGVPLFHFLTLLFELLVLFTICACEISIFFAYSRQSHSSHIRLKKPYQQNIFVCVPATTKRQQPTAKSQRCQLRVHVNVRQLLVASFMKTTEESEYIQDETKRIQKQAHTIRTYTRTYANAHKQTSVI